MRSINDDIPCRFLSNSASRLADILSISYSIKWYLHGKYVPSFHKWQWSGWGNGHSLGRAHFQQTNLRVFNTPIAASAGSSGLFCLLDVLVTNFVFFFFPWWTAFTHWTVCVLCVWIAFWCVSMKGNGQRRIFSEQHRPNQSGKGHDTFSQIILQWQRQHTLAITHTHTHTNNYASAKKSPQKNVQLAAWMLENE